MSSGPLATGRRELRLLDPAGEDAGLLELVIRFDYVTTWYVLPGDFLGELMRRL